LISKIFNFLDKNFKRIITVTILVFPLLLIVLYYSTITKKAPVREDAVGYYAYLPASFIEKDLSFSFMIDDSYAYSGGINSFENKYNISEAGILGFNQLSDDKYIDKYPVGVAVLLIPFYLIGHVLSLIFRTGLDGWSFFYQYSALYGGVSYFLIGMFFLKKILKKYFSSFVTYFTLFSIILGTNLFNYAIYENIFSHVYSFFLITLFLYLVPKWLKDKSIKNTMFLGVNLGFVTLVRPTNLIVSILIILYGTNSFRKILKRLSLLIMNYKKLLLMFAVFLIVLLPQLLYWKYATGKFFVYSYSDEGFNFFKPEILKVLFGSSKGLFFWSPLLVFAAVGLFLLKKRARKYLSAFILIFLIQLYLVSSWWNWEYGWSFGHRAFTDFFSIFAIGLACFFSYPKKIYVKIIIYSISCFLVFLSIFQMIQYWIKVLPPARTTLEDYFDIFLSLDSEKKLFWRKYFIEN